MPYQAAPLERDISDQIAIECREPGWVRCPSCGYRFFYIEEVSHAVLVDYCPKDKKQYRLHLGMAIEIS